MGILCKQRRYCTVKQVFELAGLRSSDPMLLLQDCSHTMPSALHMASFPARCCISASPLNPLSPLLPAGDAYCESPVSRSDADGSRHGGSSSAAAAGEQPQLLPSGSMGALPSCSSAAAGTAGAPLACWSLPLPRPTYCSRLVHGLPGGCRYVDLPCEHIWESLVQSMRVQVRGWSSEARLVLLGRGKVFGFHYPCMLFWATKSAGVS
jgi:hypothetical protein